MLKDISILVIEDEPLTALSIAMEVVGARGTVIGPAAARPRLSIASLIRDQSAAAFF